MFLHDFMINCHLLSEGASQIIIMTNIVVVLNAGIKGLIVYTHIKGNVIAFSHFAHFIGRLR